METLHVLRAAALGARRQVKVWRRDGLPNRTNDPLVLLEGLATAAAAAADSSLIEFQLLRAQISNLRARLDALETRLGSADAADGLRAGSLCNPIKAISRLTPEPA